MGNLSPLFKWTGGKRKELPQIKQYLPGFIKNNEKYTLIEPFFGAGAVFWNFNNLQGNNVINDYDWDVANFLRQMKKQDMKFLEYVQEAHDLFTDKTKHDDQEKLYYSWRNKDRKLQLNNLTKSERAARFWIVNQLAFSGMRRFNRAGEFNVPFGHYKSLNASALTSKEHIKLLKKTTIVDGDYKPVVKSNDNDKTFIFIDPPYTRVMKTYSSNNEFDDDSQKELAFTLKTLEKAKWMIVIDKSPLTEELYRDNIVHSYDLRYGVNIRNRFDTKVQHILATNY